MRIHTDRLKASDLYSAALIARVDMELTEHGSRSRDHAFNVLLTGESRRRPNSGKRGAGDEHAATWDQWGVFLAVLFEADANRSGLLDTRDMFTPYDESYQHFAARTGDRFGAPEDSVDPDGIGVGYVRRFVAYGWPEDAHGDHSFKWDSGRREYTCRRCSAVQRYDLAPYLDRTA